MRKNKEYVNLPENLLVIFLESKSWNGREFPKLRLETESRNSGDHKFWNHEIQRIPCIWLLLEFIRNHTHISSRLYHPSVSANKYRTLALISLCRLSNLCWFCHFWQRLYIYLATTYFLWIHWLNCLQLNDLPSSYFSLENFEWDCHFYGSHQVKAFQRLLFIFSLCNVHFPNPMLFLLYWTLTFNAKSNFRKSDTVCHYKPWLVYFLPHISVRFIINSG